MKYSIHMHFSFSTTRTDLGIDFVREHAFTKAHGDRDGVNNILIVVTDGHADQEDKTKVNQDL